MYLSPFCPQPNEVFGFATGTVAAVATNDRAQPQAFPASFISYIAAHELGHLLGLDHTNLNNRLMSIDQASNPNQRLELDKNEWDTINP